VNCAIALHHTSQFGQLHEEDISKWRALKRPKLTEEDACKRLELALEHENWDEWDFEDLIFSDECIIP